MNTFNIACLLYHHIDELEFMSVYSTLRKSESPEGFKFNTYTLAKSRNAVETESDIIISPHWGFMSAPEPDVIIIVGGNSSFACRDKVIMNYLKGQVKRLKYIIGFSEGISLLNDLGLLTSFEFENLTSSKNYKMFSGLEKHSSGVWCAGGKNIGIKVAKELVAELWSLQTGL